MGISNVSLVAPCGMNCGICSAYLREKNKCLGCRVPDDKKPITRVRCKIKTCEVYVNEKSEYCYQCAGFPCTNLRQLDHRYRTKYNMSMIENLEYIKERGIQAFVRNEKIRWTCQVCGGIICVHKKHCIRCGKNIPFDPMKPYCRSCYDEATSEIDEESVPIEYFCHACGKASDTEIEKPLCYSCYKKMT